MERTRILLADDHPKVRTLIHARLSREPDLDIVAEAGDSAQTIECALALRPRILIIDPMMKDGLGLQAVRQIVSHLPGTAIVVLTAFADPAFQIELRKLGVRRVLDKGLGSQRLIEALHQITQAE